jgi:hypothetical protein
MNTTTKLARFFYIVSLITFIISFLFSISNVGVVACVGVLNVWAKDVFNHYFLQAVGVWWNNALWIVPILLFAAYKCLSFIFVNPDPDNVRKLWDFTPDGKLAYFKKSVLSPKLTDRDLLDVADVWFLISITVSIGSFLAVIAIMVLSY